mmetsp:Transcript_12859/g.23309  ORF Transcript_12859/g.23309 Transcript_12859/m.23309 type:complete len:82 (+) Transcript_12859:122-367(+)
MAAIAFRPCTVGDTLPSTHKKRAVRTALDVLVSGNYCSKMISSTKTITNHDNKFNSSYMSKTQNSDWSYSVVCYQCRDHNS